MQFGDDNRRMPAFQDSRARYLFEAVYCGSVRAAAEKLGIVPSAVSRQISALEEEISTPLFQRHARGLTLTDEGELLFTAVTDVLGRLAAAEEALKNVHDAPRGALKITASHGIGAYWLLPRLGDFLAQYPEVDLHLVLDDKELDLAQREADLAIRLRKPDKGDFAISKLGEVRLYFFEPAATSAADAVDA